MKSIATASNKRKAPKYPYLGIYKESGKKKEFIVLFTSQKTGSVIHVEEESQWNIGFYSSEWVDEVFVPYHGQVTIHS